MLTCILAVPLFLFLEGETDPLGIFVASLLLPCFVLQFRRFEERLHEMKNAPLFDRTNHWWQGRLFRENRHKTRAAMRDVPVEHAADSATREVKLAVGDLPLPQPTYRPNFVDLDTRAVCLLGVVLLFGYATFALINDDFFIYLPGRGSEAGVEIHLHGSPVWIACAGLVSACLSMLSIVADHFDQRDNEQKYRDFAKLALKMAAALLSVALMSQAYLQGGESW